MHTARLMTSAKGYGGNVYDTMVDAALGATHEVVPITPLRRGPLRVLEVPRLFRRWREFAERTDAILIRPHATALTDFRGRGVTIVHHVDWAHSAPLIRLFESYVARRFDARRAVDEPIVVVSTFWRDYFHRRGYRNVHLIYSGFRLRDYAVSPAEVAYVREKYGLGTKPVVYLGNPQKKKGTDRCAWALAAHAGYTRVTSGPGPLRFDGVRHLGTIPFRDYAALLAASAAVITMSRFREGWNRVAHEAMLVGTPVIGSGAGGMLELLEGGGQLVCREDRHLAGLVAHALRERATLGARGKVFARAFTEERFRAAWCALVAALAPHRDTPSPILATTL